MPTTNSSAPILVCYDGSKEAMRGLDVALGLLGANPIVVLSVWQSLQSQLAESVGVIAAGEHEHFDQTEEDRARALVAEAADRARANGRDVATRVKSADETVWRAIVDVADELDAAVIVSGTRGRGPVKEMLLGSVSHAVLTHARRPVLIVPSA